MFMLVLAVVGFAILGWLEFEMLWIGALVGFVVWLLAFK